MVSLGGILTAGLVATVLPTLMGILFAYSIVATILGAFLWTAKSVPDDVGIAIAGSGIAVGVLMVIAVLLLRLVFS